MTTTQIAILKTLIYADIFDYPLAPQEIRRFLIGEKTTCKDFHQALIKLNQKQQIIKYRHYYALPKRQHTVGSRLQKISISRQKQPFVTRIATLLRLIPTVWFIGVSGNLAIDNAADKDDIDFFIITAPKTIWLTRLLSNILLTVFNLRRTPQLKKIKNKACLNMFLDSGHLLLPAGERNLFTAHEIVQLKPKLNRRSTYERFLQTNKWVLNYLPQAFSLPNITGSVNFGSILWIKPIEDICRVVQLWYMKQRRTCEVISQTMLKFHPQNAKFRILAAYKKGLKKWGLTK